METEYLCGYLAFYTNGFYGEKMKKLGLVFAGGGGKGAYEIGVWKALKEYGVDKNIKAVSGTSVGGLNGALFANGDIEQGLKVWESMSPDKILQINPQKIISAIGMLHPSTRVLTALSSQLVILKSEGIFGQKGLENIIRDSIKDGDLKDKIPLYVCATDVSDKLSWKPLYKKLNELEYEKTIKYLLATSAIPIAFPTTIVDDKELLDGFLTDNTPIVPLIEEEGCDSIIVVLLGRSESIAKLKQSYPNVTFWEIVPSGDTKELLGSLDFKQKSAKNLIEMGYNDAREILKNLHEFMQTEEQYLQKGVTLQTQDEEFKMQLQEQKLLEEKPKKSLELLSLHLEKELQSAEVQMINSNLDTVLEEMQNNSTQLSKFAFDAVTSLASNTGKINYQLEQGAFSRVLGGITGSNYKLQADINQNFSASIYANTQLIKKLAQRENLTLDVILSLGNKINFLTQQQTKLQLQDKKQLQMLEELRGALLTLGELTRDAIASNTKRIEKLEYGQSLLNWSHHLKASIQGLNSYDSVMRVLGSYYDIVKRSDDSANSDFLYSALVNLEFDKKIFNPKEFIGYVCEHKEKELLLFEHIKADEVLPLPKNYEPYTPLFASLSYHYEHKENQVETILSRFKDNYNMDLDVDMDGVSFAFELLDGLKLGSETKSSLLDSKEEMSVKLDTLLELLKKVDIDSFTQEIQTLQKKIDEFKIIVPIIGKFSSGKSKLLNSYIAPKEKLFEIDTNPTTARACEIRYATQNSVVVHKKDASTKDILVKDVNHEKMEDVVYLEYFLNFDKLKYREDLVLVDMPGFESSNLNHNDAINHYFNKGEHYILALSCESTNDNSILKHIKEIVSYGAKFSIVITKVDKKLPKDVEKLKQVLIQNIQRVYKQDNFFVGKVSAMQGEIEDFEKIVDTIYSDSATLFQRKFEAPFKHLTNSIEEYMQRLLTSPNDTIALEKELTKDAKQFESEVSELTSRLKEIEFDIVSNGAMVLQEKAQKVLESNILALVNSAKNNSLTSTIVEMIRPTLNSTFANIVAKAVKKVEDEAVNISTDLDISFSNIEINSELSLWESIKNFFFDTQDGEIRDKLRSNVIPTVVNEVSSSIKNDLHRVYNEIEKIIQTQIANRRVQSNNLQQEMQKQLTLQTQEYETNQTRVRDTLEAIKKL